MLLGTLFSSLNYLLRTYIYIYIFLPIPLSHKYSYLCYLELSLVLSTTYFNILYFTFFNYPVTTHLFPLPLYNPIYPIKAVTYADNYRCFANDFSLTLQRQLPPSLSEEIQY